MLCRKVDRIFILGDIHGDFESLNKYMKFLVKTYPFEKIAIIQCGDFNFWPEVCKLEDIKVPKDVEVFACPGNHENWDYLDDFGYLPKQVVTRVWYMPFSSILDLNGIKFMFCGGADSIDKHFRKTKISWWEQEVITYADMEQLYEKKEEKIDVVISHAAPNYFEFRHYKNASNYKDPSRDALDRTFDIFQPKYWFCGHYHEFFQGVFKDTSWTVLSDLDSALCVTEFKYNNDSRKQDSANSG